MKVVTMNSRGWVNRWAHINAEHERVTRRGPRLTLEVNIGTNGEDTGIEYVEGSYSHLSHSTVAVLAKRGYRHGDQSLLVDFN